ncbi:alpha/beta fold hydrolase [Rhodococcus opacus]|uniref:alpha/beta fold hydrolase n=1 Tax=Rhodococcus opacus TaxID=37919 RepID=UPI00247547F7|nr:alpha/beta hydrolase [Rhodococcus opacus]MDH6293201.1 3-oxoadipate enol-lactonase [Rhodococcus opacus]
MTVYSVIVISKVRKRMQFVSSHTPNGIGYQYTNVAPPWEESPATPVFFQHGIGDNRNTWAGWLPATLAERPAIGMDLRGHGTSIGADTADVSVERIGQDVIGVLDELGIGKVHYAGSSFGGMLGYYLAATAPERFLTITTHSAPYRGDWVNNLDRWKEILRTEGSSPWSEEVIAGFFTESFQVQEPAFIEWMKNAQHSLDPETAIAYFSVTQQTNLEPLLSNIHCPVLNLVGGSPIVDPRNADGLRSFVKQLENIKIPGSLHGIAMSHWRECSAAALEFMARWEPTLLNANNAEGRDSENLRDHGRKADREEASLCSAGASSPLLGSNTETV